MSRAPSAASERSSTTDTLAPPRSRSGLATPLLVALVPPSILAVACYPAVALASLIPLLGFVALPTLLSLTLFLLYAVPSILYLLLAQSDPPHTVTLPFLPFHPSRCLSLWLHLLRLVREAVVARIPSLVLDWVVRRILVLGGRDREKILKENVLYRPGARLDVYYPVQGLSPTADQDVEEPVLEVEKAPVIVYVGGGNHTFWRKSMGAQVALRLRRLGFVVVVPDLVQWPSGKAIDMVGDLRAVLSWTAERISLHGGDADQIFLLGYGSGAHISLLTVVQDSVVLSRESYLTKLETPTKSEEPVPILLSAGIRRCRLPAETTPVPRLAGIIVVAGVFDVVKQLRWEAKSGIEEVSALRRACGPSTGAVLLSCPSHLLYGASQILDPTLLPPKVLIIAGGKDVDVPYSQSVLLRSLLVGVGVPMVRLKLYREATHLGSLASLMTQTRYSPLFLSEIESIISAGLSD